MYIVYISMGEKIEFDFDIEYLTDINLNFDWISEYLRVVIVMLEAVYRGGRVN